MNKQEVLAVVAGKEITNADLDLFLERLPEEQRQYADHPYFRSQYLEQMLIIYSLCKMSEEMELDKKEEYAVMLEDARRDVMARIAMAEISKNVSVSDEEVKKFYDENQQTFQKPETVSAKHILVAEEGECLKIMSEIKMGNKSFEEAAAEYSTCPSKDNGGDLGEFGEGQMVKEFEEAAFNAEIGKVVGPVATQFGYHLILVEKKNEAAVVPFAEAEAQIKKSLLVQRQQNAYAEKVAELKEKYVQQ